MNNQPTNFEKRLFEALSPKIKKINKRREIVDGAFHIAINYSLIEVQKELQEKIFFANKGNEVGKLVHAILSTRLIREIALDIFSEGSEIEELHNKEEGLIKDLKKLLQLDGDNEFY